MGGAFPPGVRMEPSPEEGTVAVVYRLVVLDVDGTLLNSQGDIPRPVKDVIAQVQRSGVSVTLATGRRWQSTRDFVRQLDLRVPVIVHDGAVTLEPAGPRVVRYVPLRRKAVLPVVELLRQYGLDFFVFDDYFSGETAFYEAYPRYGPGRAFLAQPADVVAWREDCIAMCPARVTKILAIGPSTTIQRCAREFRERLAGAVRVLEHTRPGNATGALEVFHPEAGKGAALAALARRLGVDAGEVLAIGADVNDVDMLRIAGMGVAMGNADASVQAVARYQTRSNDENGVAVVLQELILRVG